MAPLNNKYTIKVEHPLLRPGLTIETEASEKYLTRVVDTLMMSVRKINEAEGARLEGEETKGAELKNAARSRSKAFIHDHSTFSEECAPGCGWYEIGRQTTTYDTTQKKQVPIPVNG